MISNPLVTARPTTSDGYTMARQGDPVDSEAGWHVFLHFQVPDARLGQFTADRDRITTTHLAPREQRPSSTARGLHPAARMSSDGDQTVRFCQGVLGFPLVDILENRGYPGSTHFFIGNGNTLALFDLPNLVLGPYQEVLGRPIGLHHVALSVEPEAWSRLKARHAEEGIDYMLESEMSVYFTDPVGARLEFRVFRYECGSFMAGSATAGRG